MAGRFYCKLSKTLLYILECVTLVMKWLFRNFKTGNSDSLACLVGKTAIVTGGNAGIGFATTLLLASRGCKVIIACRSDASKARDEIIRRSGNPNIETAKLDLSSFESVREFAKKINKFHPKIDILINNAGIGWSNQRITEDGLVAIMQVNYFGHFLLTHLILEPLKASGNARVVFIGSILSIFQKLKVGDLNTYPGDIPLLVLDIYSNSKFCTTLASHLFGEKLRKFNINVNAADTGVASTNILDDFNAMGFHIIGRILYYLGRILARDPLNAAQTSFHLASSEKLNKETGQLYFRCERFGTSRRMKNQKFCDDIWKKSEELVGLKAHEKIS